MRTTQDIMEAILATATNNIEKNIHQIDSMGDVEDMSLQYLERYASCISRDINGHEDKSELIQALRRQIIGTAYVGSVCIGYLEEAQRQVDMEVEDLTKEVLGS